MKEVLPSLPNYWHKVASIMGTGHTGEQCQEYNQKDVPSSIKKQKARGNKAKKGKIILCCTDISPVQAASDPIFFISSYFSYLFFKVPTFSYFLFWLAMFCFKMTLANHIFPSFRALFSSLNIIRSYKEQGGASWEHCNMCAVVSSAFPQAHVVSSVQNFPFFLCALLQGAQTVQTYPCGPWVVITFCHLFVKVNDAYVWFIAQPLPPFAASNNVNYC